MLLKKQSRANTLLKIIQSEYYLKNNPERIKAPKNNPERIEAPKNNPVRI